MQSLLLWDSGKQRDMVKGRGKKQMLALDGDGRTATCLGTANLDRPGFKASFCTPCLMLTGSPCPLSFKCRWKPPAPNDWQFDDIENEAHGRECIVVCCCFHSNLSDSFLHFVCWELFCVWGPVLPSHSLWLPAILTFSRCEFVRGKSTRWKVLITSALILKCLWWQENVEVLFCWSIV